MVESDRSLVVLQDKSASQDQEFVFLFTESRSFIQEQFFPEEQNLIQFGMMFGDPEMSSTVTWNNPNGQVQRQSRRRYFINIDDINQGFYRFIMTPQNLPRDSIAIAEKFLIALAAHEIRHELQISEEIPQEYWHQRLPKFREERLTATKRYSADSTALEYRRYLKLYGKRLIDDRDALAMELDAISVQLRSSYVWTESRGLPLEERLRRVRDIVFSRAS
ncbi:MAG: hypothetical protein KBA91_03075 [Candidatus Moranbacteria bacterium]|jgi:hypothetical protein|nr:hypothetical protein [Candidatus Moranbacteria bacterium]